MPVPGPDDPRYWPEAESVGGRWFNPPGSTFDGWFVLGELPPEPFLSWDLDVPRDWPRAQYGPPGTIWTFTATDVVERLTGLDLDHSSTVLRFVLRKFGRLPWGTVPYFFPIPNSYGTVGTPMRWIQTSLIGTIGDRETFAHVLNWRNKTVADAAVSLTECREFGALVRDRWAAHWNAALGAGAAMNVFFTDAIKYTEVRTAVLNQNLPGPWVSYGPGAGQVQHDGEMPTWEIPTQVAAFAPKPTGAGSGNITPYQVTMCISHNTNFRGPRFRGRTYMPPMSAAYTTAEGLFTPGSALSLGQGFGAFLEDVATASDYELHVVSKKFATSAKVIGTRVGIVPDTQRRRRRNLLELPVQAHGAAVGTL